MILNRQSLSALNRGFQALFQKAFLGGAPVLWPNVAMRVTSGDAQETYGWLGQTTAFREWLGDRVIQNLATSDYTIRNRAYENTVGVKKTDIDDDRIGIYGPMFENLGDDARVFPDQLVFSLLAQGFSTTCYDGQFFFDTDHPVTLADGTAGTWSNFGGGAGTPWYLIDDTRAIRPLIYQEREPFRFVAMESMEDEAVFMRAFLRYGIDGRCAVGYGLPQLAYASKQTLDATSYAAARAAMQGLKGDMGKPLGVRAALLVVPPSLEGAARTVVGVTSVATGGDNPWYNTAEIKVCPWL